MTPSSAHAVEVRSPGELLEMDAFDLAEDGIARLRDLVIECALTGRLGTGRASEQAPVNALRAAAGILAAQKRRDVGDLDPAPFALPASWVWTQPQQLGFVAPRNQLPDEATVGFVPMANVPTDYRRELAAEARRWGDVRKAYTHMADGDVVVAKITPCFQNLKSCVVRGLPSGAGAGSTELLVVRPVDGVVDPKFLLLCFKSPLFVLGGVARMTGTAGQKRVPLDYFSAAPVPLPPLAEQKRIVARVDQLMAFCDELEAMQARKAAVADSLAKAALGALVSAVSEPELRAAWGRVSEHFVAITTRASQLASLRGAVLDLAVCGHLGSGRLVAEHKIGGRVLCLPEEWRAVRISDVAIKVTDGEHATPRRAAVGRLLLSARNVRDGAIDLTDVDRVPEEEFIRIRKRCDPNRGDVLISCSGSIGRVAVVDKSDEYVMVRSAAMVRPDPAQVSAEFLHVALRAPLLQRQMMARARASAQANLFIGQIRELELPVPPLGEQARIVSAVTRLLKQIAELEDAARTLERRAARLAEALARRAMVVE